eukprot:TRINITY_DN42393_c0_g1_i1.p1 TRINITY_DN42393_c0_g1~~TRINITY_DN42393_c0_g1_i1.p1  ORF type:complete len:221 (+),score=31.02 TRINITY_DN42393_c0_g1_i1:150-812(+)
MEYAAYGKPWSGLNCAASSYFASDVHPARTLLLHDMLSTLPSDVASPDTSPSDEEKRRNGDSLRAALLEFGNPSMLQDSALETSLPCADSQVSQGPPQWPLEGSRCRFNIASLQQGPAAGWSWPHHAELQPRCSVPWAHCDWSTNEHISPQSNLDYSQDVRTDPRNMFRNDRRKRLNGLRASYREIDHVTRTSKGDAVPMEVLSIARLAVSEMCKKPPPL